MGSFNSSVSAQETRCELDKVATAFESENGGLQKMVIGGAGVQHVDYYVPGLAAVSYIVPPQPVEMHWWGFGSIWEAPLTPECEDYDWLADTEDYYTGEIRGVARKDNGHSGVTYDLRDGTVHNFGSLSDAQVEKLLADHKAAIDVNLNADPAMVDQDPANCGEEVFGGLTGCASDSSGDTDDTVVLDEGTDQSANFEADAVQHDPATGPVEFTVEDGGAVYFQFWSNASGVDQAEHRVLITEPGEYSLNGGGTYFVFPADHADEAQAMYDEDSRPVWTLEDLDGMGLVN